MARRHLQDDIALAVTDALQVVLKDKDQRHDDGSPHQVDTRAIDPYLAGLAALRLPGDLSRLKHAETSFKQAIDIDPEFAGAYAGLCRTYARQFERTHDPAPLAAADSVCRKSLELDSSLVETEKALASMAVVAGKFDSAAEAYRRLLMRNPQDADAYIGLGDALEGLGGAPKPRRPTAGRSPSSRLTGAPIPRLRHSCSSAARSTRQPTPCAR